MKKITNLSILANQSVDETQLSRGKMELRA